MVAMLFLYLYVYIHFDSIFSTFVRSFLFSLAIQIEKHFFPWFWMITRVLFYSTAAPKSHFNFFFSSFFFQFVICLFVSHRHCARQCTICTQWMERARSNENIFSKAKHKPFRLSDGFIYADLLFIVFVRLFACMLWYFSRVLSLFKNHTHHPYFVCMQFRFMQFLFFHYVLKNNGCKICSKQMRNALFSVVFINFLWNFWLANHTGFLWKKVQIRKNW